jgi:hypothetical protein
MERNQMVRKFHFSLTYTLANFANLQPRPPLLALWLVKLLYNKNKHKCIKETRIKSKKNAKPTYI